MREVSEQEEDRGTEERSISNQSIIDHQSIINQ
jgi:hypothetical protein